MASRNSRPPDKANGTDPTVDHPKHYNSNPSGVEAIDVIEHMTFNVGTAMKYLWRCGLKDGEPQIRDLKKAQWYLTREIHRIEIEHAQATVAAADAQV